MYMHIQRSFSLWIFLSLRRLSMIGRLSLLLYCPAHRSAVQPPTSLYQDQSPLHCSIFPPFPYIPRAMFANSSNINASRSTFNHVGGNQLNINFSANQRTYPSCSIVQSCFMAEYRIQRIVPLSNHWTDFLMLEAHPSTQKRSVCRILAQQFSRPSGLGSSRPT
jgi:hypothetical protein